MELRLDLPKMEDSNFNFKSFKKNLKDICNNYSCISLEEGFYSKEITKALYNAGYVGDIKFIEYAKEYHILNRKGELLKTWEVLNTKH